MDQEDQVTSASFERPIFRAMLRSLRYGQQVPIESPPDLSLPPRPPTPITPPPQVWPTKSWWEENLEERYSYPKWDQNAQQWDVFRTWQEEDLRDEHSARPDPKPPFKPHRQTLEYLQVARNLRLPVHLHERIPLPNVLPSGPLGDHLPKILQHPPYLMVTGFENFSVGASRLVIVSADGFQNEQLEKEAYGPVLFFVSTYNHEGMQGVARKNAMMGGLGVPLVYGQPPDLIEIDNARAQHCKQYMKDHALVDSCGVKGRF